MKKLSKILASSLISSMLFANVAFASDLNMKVNNTTVQFQYGTPFIDSGSSLLPLRDLLIALGVKNDDEHIRWNGDVQSVTIVKDSKTVILSVGSKQIYLNGKLHATLEVPAQNVNGRVFLPARAVAEALGYFVGFDAESSTILVQEVPFGGGVKADDYSDQGSASGTGIDSINLALTKYANGLTLSDETTQLLSKNEADFFALDRSQLSLEKVAKFVSEKEIAKNVSSFQTSIVNLTFVQIDTIREIKLENGQTITGAVGHVGGTYDSIADQWKDSTYFQVFFSGTTKIVKGDKATVNGIPVGEGSVELTNALGKTFTEPMYVIVAGNFLTTSEEYDIKKERSEENPGKISIPDLDKEVQKKLDRLQLTLNESGLKIFDPFLNGMEIKSVQVGEFTYKPKTKTTIPDMSYDGLTIPLDSFVDDKGQAFSAKNGSFFVKITTNLGETVKFVDFQ